MLETPEIARMSMVDGESGTFIRVSERQPARLRVCSNHFDNRMRPKEMLQPTPAKIPNFFLRVQPLTEEGVDRTHKRIISPNVKPRIIPKTRS